MTKPYFVIHNTHVPQLSLRPSLTFFLLLAEIFFLSLPLLAKETVIINEIMYDYPGSDDRREWIEIYNSGTENIDLTDWRLFEAETDHKLILKQGTIIILPREYAIIANNAETFLNDHQIYKGILFNGSFSLSNSGEYLALKNSSQEVVNGITYQSSWGAKGNGKTLERQKDSPGWQESFVDGGTPGIENSQEPSSLPSKSPPVYSPGQIVINEFVSIPDDEEEEWIELFNKTNSLINLNGWIIEEGSKSVTNLDGEIIAHGFAVINKPKGYLNNKGDILILKDPSGKIIDQITYGDWNDGNLRDNAPRALDSNSLARAKDGLDSDNDFNDFRITTSITKGSSNIIASPEGSGNFGGLANGEGSLTTDKPGFSDSGRIIINEILPNPKDSDQKEEFIELKNLGLENVNLGGWKLSDESSRIYTITSKDFTAVTILAGGFFILPREKTKIALNNTEGDAVKLFQPNGGLVDSIKYTGSAKENQSYARCPSPGARAPGLPTGSVGLPTGSAELPDCNSNQWVWTTTPTPGRENKITLPNNPPEAVINVKEKAGLGEKIIFDASDSSDPDGDSLSYSWDFGDSGKATQIRTAHVYQKAGSYKVKLSIEDSGGLKDEAGKTIVISSSEDSGELSVANGSLSLNREVRINEFLPNPQGPDPEEWIEIYNQAKEAIDLSNWELDDIADGGSRQYRISEKTIIQGGQYLIFKKEKTKITLNNTYDTVRLIDALGNIISEINYDEPLEGASYARDRNGQWKWTFTLTSGRENIITLPPGLLKKDPPGQGKFIETTLDKIHQFDLGDQIRVKGIVSVEPGILGSQIFYLTGSNGIQVYQSKKDFPKLKLGDQLEVEGILSEAGGEKRIKLASAKAIKILAHQDPPKPLETEISLLKEEQVGSLIALQGNVTEKKSNYFWLDDKSEEIKVYLKASVGLEKINFKINDQVKVTGILRFSKGDFRLLPRYKSDLELIQDSSKEPASLTTKFSANQKEKEMIQYLLLTTGALVVILGGIGIHHLKMNRRK